MSIEQVQSFIAIAEEGAITRAAERLHISQPPLTRRLSALEDELGVALFQRHSRGVLLTEEGRRFLPYAERLLAAEKAASRLFRPGFVGDKCKRTTPPTNAAYPPAAARASGVETSD